jgi:hypothetical protein
MIKRLCEHQAFILTGINRSGYMIYILYCNKLVQTIKIDTKVAIWFYYITFQ